MFHMYFQKFYKKWFHLFFFLAGQQRIQSLQNFNQPKPGIFTLSTAPPFKLPNLNKVSWCIGKKSKTRERDQVEIFALEGEWTDTLSKIGWSVSATNIIKICFASSSLRLYNRQIFRLRNFVFYTTDDFPQQR